LEPAAEDDTISAMDFIKKSLGHLPKRKRDELACVVEVIRKGAPQTEMIILFGSYARGDHKEQADLAPDRKSGHVSDYDIFVVTADKKTAGNVTLWSNITQKCDELNLSTHVRIIAHDIEFLNIQLAKGQYFFADIKKEGCMLYNSGNHTLSRKRKLKPREQQRIAQDHFDHWFTSAKDSFFMYEQALRFRKYKEAAFNLHQAAERSYKTILLVFTNYSPQEHYLIILSRRAEEHSRDILGIFPQDTEEQKERFNLLDYAYIGARYDPDYKITRAELKYLAERVQKLKKITQKVCKKRIQGFTE
jgi:predicted nucleotidyltransferase/HEPN domain-containing protein